MRELVAAEKAAEYAMAQQAAEEQALVELMAAEQKAEEQALAKKTIAEVWLLCCYDPSNQLHPHISPAHLSCTPHIATGCRQAGGSSRGGGAREGSSRAGCG